MSEGIILIFCVVALLVASKFASVILMIHVVGLVIIAVGAMVVFELKDIRRSIDRAAMEQQLTSRKVKTDERKYHALHD